MKSIFKFEFKKFLYFKSTLVTLIIIGIYSIINGVVMFSLAQITNSSRANGVGHIVSTTDFTNVLFLYFFAAIIASIFLAKDIQSGTIKIALTSGKPRYKIFFTKLISLCAYAFIMVSILYLLSTLSATLFTGWGTSEEYNTVWYSFRAYLLGVASFIMILSIVMFISYLSKNNVITIIGTIGLYFLEIIIMSIIRNYEGIKQVVLYSPSSAIANVISQPDSNSVRIFLVVFLIAFIFCNGLSFLLFRKMEIK